MFATRPKHIPIPIYMISRRYDDDHADVDNMMTIMMREGIQKLVFRFSYKRINAPCAPRHRGCVLLLMMMIIMMMSHTMQSRPTQRDGRGSEKNASAQLLARVRLSDVCVDSLFCSCCCRLHINYCHVFMCVQRRTEEGGGRYVEG